MNKLKGFIVKNKQVAAIVATAFILIAGYFGVNLIRSVDAPTATTAPIDTIDK